MRSSSLLVLATFVIPLILLVSGTDSSFTIESVRESLIRQEDSVVFCMIERTNYPFNSPVYQQHLPAGNGGDSMVDSVVNETEAIQSKLGRYEREEENPFFPNMLPPSLEPPRNRPKFLHPAGSLININTIIRDMYLNQLLPLFIPPGDDGNYVQTAASDLHCLQVLSRRIHYGKFVAEVKFRDAPGDYGPAIRDQDRDALTKLLTFKDVEEMVRKRVKKKAMVFGQEVTIGGNNNNNSRSYKVDPSVVSRLYKEWVIPSLNGFKSTTSSAVLIDRGIPLRMFIYSDRRRILIFVLSDS